MRAIVYVDGAVGAGKSTFISALEQVFNGTLSVIFNGKHSCHKYNVQVLPEPLHRDWTETIVKDLGYEQLLRFLLIRKKAAIEAWDKSVMNSPMQDLEANILIVERSMFADRLVREGWDRFEPNCKIETTADLHHIMVRDKRKETEEQCRLVNLYNDMSMSGTPNEIFIRPLDVSDYYRIAARTVSTVLGQLP